METTDLAAEIASAATQPAAAAVDGQEAKSHPIPDLIKADQYLTAKRAAARRGVFGLWNVGKAIPPGAGGDSC